MTTTTPLTAEEKQTIEDLLDRIDVQIIKLQNTEEDAMNRGEYAKASTAREGVTCLQWAAAYLNHGRFEDAEKALKAAKVRIREVYA